MTALRSGTLAGVRVVDLTQMLAGPYATMVLADLGADVIKIEPLTGDSTRGEGPFLGGAAGGPGLGGYFQSINRNKRSVALDLKSGDGRDALLRIIDSADILVENFRAGVMDRLGLAYEVLADRNPRLVYAAIRGFGDPRTGESPYLDRPAFDVIAQAMGGLVGVTGPSPAQPTKAGPGVGDIFPAVLACVGILAALHRARESGTGQFLDVAMYDAMVALCERVVYQYSYTGDDPQPEGNGHPLLSPFGIFQTSDGWVAIAAPREGFWRELCTAMGRPELISHPFAHDRATRVQHRDWVHDAVQAWTIASSTTEVVDALVGRVPCGPVNQASAIFADPHLAVREMLVEVEEPATGKHVVVAGCPIKMTHEPAGAFHRAPLLGEHTDDVLRALGYSDVQLHAMHASATILVAEPTIA